MSTQGHPVRITLTAKEKEEVRSELVKILGSSPFQSSKRCHDFLELIVSRTIEGDTDSLTERFLGADLFGRPVDYDTKTDAIVRVRANDVRRRLADYYSAQRTAPAVVITLSSGSYVPEFHRTAPQNRPADIGAPVTNRAAVLSADDQNRDGTIPAEPVPDLAATSARKSGPAISPGRQNSHWVRFAIPGAIIAAIVILMLSSGCLVLWYQLRGMQRALYPWQSSPSVSEFWNTFLRDQADTDLVLSDSSYSLIQDLTHKPISLNEYLSHSYTNRLQSRDPEMTAALNRISNWGLGSSGEFEVAQRFLALDPARQKIHLYYARKYMPDLIKRDNVILVGSPFGNPWAELFEGRMNFTFEPENPNEIANRSPSNGESRTYEYTSSGSLGYCILAYLPTPDHNGSALLIQGTSAEPTQAAGDFLLSETQMAGLKKVLGVSKLPYFELLLKTSWVKGTPITSSIVAYRTYPEG